jgi:putative membrane protein
MAASSGIETLALYRTMLANRRTYLAFCRTGLSFLAGGIAAIKILNHPLWTAAGWGFIAAAVAVAIHGWTSHRRITKAVREVQESQGIPGDDLD